MNLLDPTYISENCDYSFGDQSGAQYGLSVLKDANLNNHDFLNKVSLIKKERNWMTLFIDNIRLYRRPSIKYTASELINSGSKEFKDKLVEFFFNKNDLLELCSELDMNFIIFTGFEDTPIDAEIANRIPKNVINIFASNSIYFGGKVSPIPYGIKRKLGPWDISHEILIQKMKYIQKPEKLVYCNFSITNNDRLRVQDYFVEKNWATLDVPRDFPTYLDGIKNHKFVICPDGNAIGCECHRDWETLYMRRVPIVKDSKYLRKIFDGFPVLFVKDFRDVDENLLKENDHLYNSAVELDFSKLDYGVIYQDCVQKSLESTK